MKILKSGRYSSLESDMARQIDCPVHATPADCPNIQQFHDGCPSTETVDGLVVFRNPFNQADCKPKVYDYKRNNKWVETYKLYVGYDDFVQTLPGGLEIHLDNHKIYEIKCKLTFAPSEVTPIQIQR